MKILLVLTRGSSVVAAYLMTSVVVLGAAIWLKGLVSPVVLAGVLSIIFISGLSSALEPGTTKALLVAGRLGGASRPDIEAVALASVLKGLAVAVPLGILWRVIDLNIGWGVIAWIPVICVTGFLTTDLRVLLDSQGRHGAAIWLKQGGLTLGFLALALSVAFGASLALAVAISSGVRVVWTAGGLGLLLAGGSQSSAGEGIGQRTLGLLTHKGWLDFAAVSILAALSGSADRLIALRFLNPTDYASYFVAFELLTKMWLLPYLAAPILFARHAQGQFNPRTLQFFLIFMGVVSLGYALLVVAMSLIAPVSVREATGLVHAPTAGLLVFGVSAVMSSYSQLLLVDLQARGAARAATILTGVSMIGALVLFYPLTLFFGLSGLLWSWLGKSAFELVISFVLFRRTVGMTGNGLAAG